MTSAPMPIKILILDDEQDFCSIFKFQFEKENFQVLIAAKITDAMKFILDDNPACVISDIRLAEGEDGLTFLRKLRSYRDDDLEVQNRVRKIPVIILTAIGFQMQSLFISEGVTDYIEKPYDVKVLKEKILHS